jgi:hypothetical protein
MRVQRRRNDTCGQPVIKIAVRAKVDRNWAGVDAFGKLKHHQSAAGVVQWQNGSFPSCIRGFDSLRPLQVLSPF